ncbi:MAG: DUF2461 domain-containing protein [Eubacteriales bacterium]|nr:DUF2461 domain-containing protein [Eubacteriales bacterium]
MFTGFTDKTLEFMLNIRFNNNKEFMHSNKDDYITHMRTPFYELIDVLAPTMQKIDPDMEIRPNKCLSRLHRDTRFSKDKSTYRDHHWIAFRRRNFQKEKVPMFWMELRVESLSWGLGFWGPNRNAMELIRKHIIEKPEVFFTYNKLINKNNFALKGDKYKRSKAPESLPKELLPWYDSKELLICRQNINQEIAFSPKLADVLAKEYLALAPIYNMMLTFAMLAQEG